MYRSRELKKDLYGDLAPQYWDSVTENFELQPKIATEATVSSERILLNQKDSGEGVLVPAKGEWVSDFLKTDGLTYLTYYTSLSDGGFYELSIIPSFDGKAAQNARGIVLVENDTTSINAFGTKQVRAPYVQVKIKNTKEIPLRIATFLYATRE